MSEHTGLPCRHSLKVLVHLDRTEIPRENIMHRWTRQAGCQLKDPSSGCPWEKVVSQTTEAKRWLLVMRALELSESKGQLDDSSLNEAIRAIENIIGPKENREQLLVAAETSSASNMLAVPGEMTLACPPRPKRTGKPRDTSQKSWKRHSKLEKEIRRGRGKENDCAEGADCGSNQSKTRSLSDLLQVTNKA